MLIKRSCLCVRRVIKWSCIGIRTLLKRICIRARKVLEWLRGFLCRFFTCYLWKGIWAVLRVSFGLVILCMMVALVIGIGVRVGDMTIMNQSFSALFDSNLLWPLGILLICCCFWLVSLVASFSDKPIKNWYVHL
jgi:hypothetical protein